MEEKLDKRRLQKQILLCTSYTGLLLDKRTTDFTTDFRPSLVYSPRYQLHAACCGAQGLADVSVFDCETMPETRLFRLNTLPGVFETTMLLDTGAINTSESCRGSHTSPEA